MIGRMSTMQFSLGGVNNILDAQAQVARLQEQLGTGKAILTPSDDPTAYVQLTNLKTELSRVESYQKNIAALTSSLSFEEATLTTANGLLLRVRELTIQGQNGTLSDSDRAAIASEIDSIRDQLLGIANTKNANDEYIFAGSASTAAAYSEAGVFQGDTVIRQINIASGIRVGEGHSGSEVFESVSDEDNLFTVLDNLSLALTDNDQDAVSSSFLGVENAIEQLSTVRTSIGTRMNWIDDQAALNENFNLSLNRTISSIEDLDVAEAISQLNLQMVSLQAAQQTFVKTQNLSIFNYL